MINGSHSNILLVGPFSHLSPVISNYFLILSCNLSIFLFQISGLEDRVITDDDVVCTFLRDLSGRQSQLNARYHDSSLTLTDLLLGFFKFYGNFDYKHHTVCILTGECQPKRTQTSLTKHIHSCLSITNPLEPDLNVCANVTSFGLDFFKAKCQLGHKHMMNVELGNEKPRLDLLLGTEAPTSIKKVNVQEMFQDNGKSEPLDLTKIKEEPRRAVQSAKKGSTSSEKAPVRSNKLKVNNLFKR